MHERCQAQLDQSDEIQVSATNGFRNQIFWQAAPHAPKGIAGNALDMPNFFARRPLCPHLETTTGKSSLLATVHRLSLFMTSKPQLSGDSSNFPTTNGSGTSMRYWAIVVAGDSANHLPL
jgi:hypothetical protein